MNTCFKIKKNFLHQIEQERQVAFVKLVMFLTTKNKSNSIKIQFIFNVNFILPFLLA